MFLIVEFMDSKAVNIIPESWFDDGTARWPNYTSDNRINRAVQKNEEPGEDWKAYDVRVLIQTSDYIKARSKLKASLTCNTSELQTDDGEVVWKRKIKQRIIFTDTESDGETEGDKRKRPSNFSSAPAPLIPPPTPNVGSSETHQASARQYTRHTESFIAGATTQPIDTSTLPSSPLCHTEFAQEQSQFGQSYTAPIPHALVPHLSPTPVHQLSRPPHEDGHQEHVFRPSSRLGKTGCASIPCSAAELHILTLLEHIKQQQMQLAVTVNSLAAGRGTETPVPEMPNVNLPLSTLSEVEEFEEWLKDQANSCAKQNMVSVLGAVGGQNPKKTTWNILSRLFSDAVAKQINWKGVNGKKCFKEMLTRSLLIRAVRKNPSSACAADTDIDCFAIGWFNLASDRGGGRKERQKAKEASA